MPSELPIAIIGLGRRIATVVANLSGTAPGLRVMGYADPSPTGLEQLAQAGIDPGQAFEDAAAMLSALKPAIVFVGSPNHLHLVHIEAALAAGARVFTEKPVVRTEEESWTLARLIAEAGEDRLIVGLVLRSAPLTRAISGHLAAGRLGRLISLEGNEHLHPEHGAFLMRDWRRSQALGGSFLLDKCCHDFDLYNAFAGARPARVASFGGRDIFTERHAELAGRRYPDGSEAYSLWPGGWNAGAGVFTSDADVADHQAALVEYENGVRLSFNANSHSGLMQRRLFLAGTEGALEADFVTNDLRLRDALGNDGMIREDFEGTVAGHYGADAAMARDLAAHFLEGAPFPVGLREAMVAGLTVMAVDRARDSGTVVDCAPLWAKLDRLLPPKRLPPKS